MEKCRVTTVNVTVDYGKYLHSPRDAELLVGA